MLRFQPRQEPGPPEATSLWGLQNHGVNASQAPELWPCLELWAPQDGAERGRGCCSPRAPGWIWAHLNVGVSGILGIHVKQNHFSTTGRPESHTQTSCLVSPPCSLTLSLPFSPLHPRSQCGLCVSGALSSQKGPAETRPSLLSLTSPAVWGLTGFWGAALYTQNCKKHLPLEMQWPHWIVLLPMEIMLARTLLPHGGS